MALSLGCEVVQVKEGAVQLVPDVDPLLQVANSMGQHTGEEGVEKDWSYNTALPHTIADCEGFHHVPSGKDLASHVFMEDLDHLHKLKWAYCSFKDCPKSFPADGIEGLGQINEHRVECHVLFDTLLLKLTHGKNHVHFASANPEATLCLRKIMLRNGNESVKDDPGKDLSGNGEK